MKSNSRKVKKKGRGERARTFKRRGGGDKVEGGNQKAALIQIVLFRPSRCKPK